MSKKFYLDDFSDKDNISLVKCNKKIKKKKNKKNKKNKKLKNNIEITSPQLNIYIDYDDNNEKIVILSLDLPSSDDVTDPNDIISLDLSINKNLYLLIGKELFS